MTSDINLSPRQVCVRKEEEKKKQELASTWETIWYWPLTSTHACVHTWICTHMNMHINTWTCVHTWACTCTWIFIHTWICAHMSIHTNMHTHECVHTNMYMHRNKHTRACTYNAWTCTHMNIYIYMTVYTHMSNTHACAHTCVIMHTHEFTRKHTHTHKIMHTYRTESRSEAVLVQICPRLTASSWVSYQSSSAPSCVKQNQNACLTRLRCWLDHLMNGKCTTLNQCWLLTISLGMKLGRTERRDLGAFHWCWKRQSYWDVCEHQYEEGRECPLQNFISYNFIVLGGAGKMAQLVRCLPWGAWGPDLYPQNPCFKKRQKAKKATLSWWLVLVIAAQDTQTEVDAWACLLASLAYSVSSGQVWDHAVYFIHYMKTVLTHDAHRGSFHPPTCSISHPSKLCPGKLQTPEYSTHP